MIDPIQFAVAVGTLAMAATTLYLAYTTSRGLKESILVRKRAWTKKKIDYLHTLQLKIDRRIGDLPKDTRITLKISRREFPSLSIKQDKINKTEIFFLLSESFLSELEARSQKYEEICIKKQKKPEDFDELERLLHGLKEITMKELDSNMREYKSITSKLNKM